MVGVGLRTEGAERCREVGVGGGPLQRGQKDLLAGDHGLGGLGRLPLPGIAPPVAG